jgi:hypothetical protein
MQKGGRKILPENQENDPLETLTKQRTSSIITSSSSQEVTQVFTSDSAAVGPRVGGPALRRPPAFQEYGTDLLSIEAVRLMSLAERCLLATMR